MRPQTLKDLAEKHGIRLPESLREHHLLRLTPDERGWFRFQRLYDAARQCVRDREPAGLGEEAVRARVALRDRIVVEKSVSDQLDTNSAENHGARSQTPRAAHAR